MRTLIKKLAQSMCALNLVQASILTCPPLSAPLFKHAKQRGLTLIELVITIVVLGIALSALVSALTTGIGRSAQPMWEGKALELTQAYLDEILAKKFDDQTPLGGGQVLLAGNPCTISTEGQARLLFDDLDDYNGVADAPPVLIDTGVDMSRYANYQVDITVVCAGTQLGVTNASLLTDNTLAKRITVSVSVPSGEVRSVSVYKGNF
jgi:MSHA pilin protein MshD